MIGDETRQDEELDVSEEEAEVTEPKPKSTWKSRSKPEPKPEAAPPVVPFDEGVGRGGAYRLDEDGNRVLVRATESDGAKELNKAANKGPFAARPSRQRPPQ